MKNVLGHDDNSEIITLIQRMRENRFSILTFDDDLILFELTLFFTSSVPVQNTTTQKIKYVIERKISNNRSIYFLKQIKGKESREISFIDGYTIWSLLQYKKYN